MLFFSTFEGMPSVNSVFGYLSSYYVFEDSDINTVSIELQLLSKCCLDFESQKEFLEIF